MTRAASINKFSNSTIPSDWDVKRLDQFAPLQRGFDLPVEKIIEGNFPVVFSNGILKFHNEFKAKAPGVVTGRSGTIGKVTFVEKDYWPHNTSLWVTNFNGNDPKFVYYFYIHFKIEKFASGSGVPTLNRNDVHGQIIIVPPLSEQKAIAHILSLLDTAINTNNSLIAKKELQKKWLMQNLLTGKKRLRGFSGKLREIRLGEIGEIKTSSVDKVIVEGEKIVNLVNYMDVYKNKFISTEYPFKKTSVNNRELSTFNLKKGDILFTPSSETPDDIGHSAVVTADLKNTVYSYHLVRYRLFEETVLEYDFRAYVFNNQNILNEFSRRATGSTRFTISKNDFEEIKTNIPETLKEQSAIAKVLQAADKEIQLLKTKSEKLREKKKWLMQVLLTGKVRVKVNKT